MNASWATTVPEIFVIVALAAGVLVYFKSEVTKKTVSNLTQLAEALEKRVDALESEREELIQRVNVLERENSVLRSLVTGDSKATELLSVTEENHAEVMGVLSEIRDAFTA
jgi:cell division protein FtsB